MCAQYLYGTQFCNNFSFTLNKLFPKSQQNVILLYEILRENTSSIPIITRNATEWLIRAEFLLFRIYYHFTMGKHQEMTISFQNERTKLSRPENVGIAIPRIWIQRSSKESCSYLAHHPKLSPKQNTSGLCCLRTSAWHRVADLTIHTIKYLHIQLFFNYRKLVHMYSWRWRRFNTKWSRKVPKISITIIPALSSKKKYIERGVFNTV